MKTNLYQASALAALALAFTGCDKKNDAISERGEGRQEGRHRRAWHRGDQGHRRGRLHLRPADRDELRGDVRILPWTRTPASTRRRSTRSRTRPASSPTRTRRSSRPTATRPIPSLWLDLRAEPIVLSVPAVEKERYYSVQLCDGNTFNYGYIGSRATGNEAGDYLVVGPDWKGETPAGIKKVFHSTTQFSLAAYRTQLFNPDDMPNVVKVQAGYKVQPLSAFLKQPAPPAAPAIDFPKINKELVKTNFFEYLDFALQFAPAGPEEKEIRAKLASIGIGAGQDLRLQGPLARAQGRRRPRHEGGRGEGRDKFVEHRQEDINGWKSRLVLRRPRLLQRRLAAARRRCQGRHLRQRRRRSHVSDDPHGRRRRDARRQQAQLHAHLPRRAVPAGERLLVGDDV